jgi:uncharacterized protein (TIGR02284 family)
LKTFGEELDKGGSVTGAAHRTWMEVKYWFSADDDESMLEEAIRGEKAALNVMLTLAVLFTIGTVMTTFTSC